MQKYSMMRATADNKMNKEKSGRDKRDKESIALIDNG